MKHNNSAYEGLDRTKGKPIEENEDYYEKIQQRTSDAETYEQTITFNKTAAATSNADDPVYTTLATTPQNKSESDHHISGRLVVGFIVCLLVCLIVGVGIGYGIAISAADGDCNNQIVKGCSCLADVNKSSDASTPFSDCSSIHATKPSGKYNITVGGTLLPVNCDMSTPGGRWLVFQRRINGSTNFYRNWTEYENGFGDVNGEFWLGNKYLNKLTSARNYKLRVELHDFNGTAKYAQYSTFSIGSTASNYTLNVSGYSGDAGDSLLYQNGMQFSTFDVDHDLNKNGSCAVEYQGAWWYNNCHWSNLNGAYLGGIHTSVQSFAQGVEWFTWTKHRYSLKFTEMKISSSDSHYVPSS